MLPKKHRADRRLFDKVGSCKSRLLSSMFFSLKVFHLSSMSSKQSPMGRFAVIVSKKATSKAVRRNLIRRIVYSTVKDSGLPSKTTDFFIFIAKKEIDQAGRLEIREDVHSLFCLLGAWSEDRRNMEKYLDL